jgi:hypothetical protein
VLFVNDPRLTPAMIATTLVTAGPPLPRRVIAGPRATACDGAALTLALAAQGYAPAEAQPLNEALILHHD